jgi:hypothetical protein
MMLVVGVALMIMRMGEAMRIRMRVGALFGAAGIVVVVVHPAGVPRAGAPVNRRVIA